MSTAAPISKKRWTRILPIAIMMYTIAYIDRSNISFAFAGMEESLGFGATISGLAAGIFFIGFLLLQIPAGHIASHGSAKKFVAIALVIWGILTVITGFVQTANQLLILRFLLGVCEGGVFPATLVLISKWFPLHERGRANALFIACIPIGAILMSPMAGWILAVFNDWRWLFFVTGALPLLWVFIWWFGIEDDPSKAKWLSDAEKKYIQDGIKEDNKKVNVTKNASYREVFTNKNVLLLVLFYFLYQIGFTGFSLWLPSLVGMVTNAGALAVGIITALPWVAALIGLYVNSRHSDSSGERVKHVAIPLFIGALFLFTSIAIGESAAIVSLIFMIIALGTSFSMSGTFFTIPAQVLPAATLGVALGLINGVGNLGGFFGPFIVGYLSQMTGSFMGGMTFLVVSWIIASGVIYYKIGDGRTSVQKVTKAQRIDTI